MKKILKYISLLAGVAFLTAACSQSDIDGNASEEMGTLRLSVNIGGSRADAYNALDRSIMRVYKIENGEEKLIRKYQPATEAPGDFYLVAGSYRIKVEAGDQSQATFTNKSYYGELDVDIEPQQTVLKEVVCPTTNIGVKVVFDQTILDKMDPGFKAYVSAIDTFSKTEAENGSVPTLKYTENATGYYLLPEDVHNLSWGFYSSSTELGSVSKTGVIPTPESGNLYTLTFKYSKTPNGYLGITVQVDQDGEIHEDPFIFSPQPTIKGDGFDINSVIGFNTDDISFAVSSVQALSGISIKANDETIQVLSDGSRSQRHQLHQDRRQQRQTLPRRNLLLHVRRRHSRSRIYDDRRRTSRRYGQSPHRNTRTHRPGGVRPLAQYGRFSGNRHRSGAHQRQSTLPRTRTPGGVACLR